MSQAAFYQDAEAEPFDPAAAGEYAEWLEEFECPYCGKAFGTDIANTLGGCCGEVHITRRKDLEAL
jgi:hypothetical protein